MSLIYNGTTVTNVVYNDIQLNTLIYNGVTVFSLVSTGKGIFYNGYHTDFSNSIIQINDTGAQVGTTTYAGTRRLAGAGSF